MNCHAERCCPHLNVPPKTPRICRCGCDRNCVGWIGNTNGIHIGEGALTAVNMSDMQSVKQTVSFIMLLVEI